MRGKLFNRRLSFGEGIDLSPAARNALSLHPVVRDMEWTVPAAVLSRMLEARGLPLLSRAIDFEATAGGALLPNGSHLGVFASLRVLEGQGALPSDQSDFPVGHRRVSCPQLIRSELGSMLPGVVHADPEVWFDAKGGVHFVNVDNDWGYRERAFETFAQYIEVFSLVRESIVWPPEHVPPQVHRLFTPSLAGEQLAGELGAWPVEEALGPTSRVWVTEGSHVVELTIPGFVVGTHFGSSDISDIFAVIRRLDPRSTNIEWQCPVGARSPQWAAAGLLQPTRSFAHGPSSIHSWGSVPHYGLDMKICHASEATRTERG